jgi:hypothetical protein
MKMGSFSAIDLSYLSNAGHPTTAGVGSAVNSASVIVSRSRLMLVWIFWTGPRKLHRGNCGQSWSVLRQLTIRIGPSSARTTSPTVISLGVLDRT